MLRKLMGVAAVAALVVAGCSDDDETTSTEPATTETASPEDPSATSTIVTTDAPATTEAAPTTDPPDSTASTTDATSDAGNGDAQYDSLASRPWASPDDAHETPEAAVEAFLGFATSAAAGGLFERDDVAIGGYSEGDARSGEVNVQFVQLFTDTSRGTSVLPEITVLVRRAGPQDTWWVVAAATDGLTVVVPAADATIEAAFALDLTNDMIVDRVEQRLFDAGADDAFHAASFSGGGIFTTGRHAATFDTASCDVVMEEGGAFEVDVCDGPGTAGAEGTLVVVSTAGITTVPVVFAQ